MIEQPLTETERERLDDERFATRCRGLAYVTVARMIDGYLSGEMKTDGVCIPVDAVADRVKTMMLELSQALKWADRSGRELM